MHHKQIVFYFSSTIKQVIDFMRRKLGSTIKQPNGFLNLQCGPQWQAGEGPKDPQNTPCMKNMEEGACLKGGTRHFWVGIVGHQERGKIPVFTPLATLASAEMAPRSDWEGSP